MFPKKPTLSFRATDNCLCGAPTTLRKTEKKIIATLDIGKFTAVERQTACTSCDKTYRSEKLRELTPHRGKFGFDVIETIGKSLFVHCHSEQTIQHRLAEKNIAISLREIAFLGKRFIITLALAHKQSQTELKQYMASKGGYILHMDGTCEGGSPHLFSCIDAISNIVLGNRKMPTEDSQYIIPLLQDLKAAYGNPIALMHDMGSAILKAVNEVFPDLPDYVCHFHFLRDLGKDLFEVEYRIIRRTMRSYRVKSKLKKVLKQLKANIDECPTREINLEDYLGEKNKAHLDSTLDPTVFAYLLIAWVLEYASASNGFGFPLDRPHLDFYLRLQEAYPLLKRLKKKDVSLLPLTLISRTLNDAVLKKHVCEMQEKISVFDRLRDAMRIAIPDNKKGLNDNGDDDIQTIETRVKEFRYSDEVVALASSHVAYHKMIRQIDKYWDKLFADPIEIETSVGKFWIQPQRTNNILEQSFRHLKQGSRKKSGQRDLGPQLNAMIADTPLVKNLSNPDYLAILLKGQTSLAKRFAEIDIALVLKEDQENDKRFRRYPKRMRRLFKIPHLPQILVGM